MSIERFVKASGLYFVAFSVIGGALWFAIPRGHSTVLGLIIAVFLLQVCLISAYRVGFVLWLGAPLLGPLFPVGNSNIDQVGQSAGTVALILGILSGELKTRGLRTPYVLVPMIAAMGITAVANYGAGLSGVFRLLVIAIGIYALSDLRDNQRLFAQRAFIVIMLISAITVLQQPLSGWPAPYVSVEGIGVRYGGLIGHPNFAAYSLGVAVLFLALTRHSWYAVASLPLLVAAAIATGSRTAVVVLVALLVFGVVIWNRAKLLMVAAVLAVSIPFASSLVSRLSSIDTSGGIGGSNAGGWRIGQWERAWALGEGRRVFGLGWGQAEHLLPQQLGVHNLYLQVVVELGWLGAIGLLLSVCIHGAAVWGSRSQRLILVYCLVTSLVDPVFLYPSVLTLLMALTALDGSVNGPPSTSGGLTVSSRAVASRCNSAL